MKTTANTLPTGEIQRLRRLLLSPALALSLAALFWSGNFVVGRALRNEIDPVTLNFARWLIALALLAPFVSRDMRANLPVLRREWLLIVGLAATGIAAFHTAVYIGLQTTTAANAMLTAVLVPLAILAGAILLGVERPGARHLAGALLSTVGAVVLIARGKPAAFLSADFNAGDLWMLTAVVIWAAYCLLLRRCPADLPQSVALTASIAVGTAMLAPFWLLQAQTPLIVFTSASVLFGVSYIAIFASVIAFLLWSYGVSRLGAGRAGQYVLLMPLFGTVLAALVLGETVTIPQFIGGSLVLVGIVAVEWRDSPRSRLTHGG
jgi:drug/metabolite transporter (DMT)-like permease